MLFPSFCIFLVFSDILPAEPSTGSSLRMPGSTIKKNLLSLPGNTSFRKHKRFFFFFCSLFCFFLLFWNNNIQYNRRNSCRNNTGAAENQLDVKIILLNNEALGLVHQQQSLFYQQGVFAATYPGMINFMQIAAGFGLQTCDLNNEVDPQPARKAR